MSDKQLTVAELLARSGRGAEESKTPRPRRRRSLEEGGISVAELTGSIPAVKAKPAESKHSSVPIDAPAEKPPAPAAKVEEKQAEKTGKTELSPVDRTAAKVAEKQSEKSGQATPTSASPAPATRAPGTPTPGTPTPGTPTPGTDETVVFRKIRDDEPEIPDQPKKAAPVPEAGETPAVATAGAAATVAPEVTEKGDVEKQAELDVLDDVDDAETAEAAEDLDGSEEKTSATGVILMALIGIVLGVVVFKGFELLWENFSRPVVAVLAVVATLGIVGVVKALRTANDGLSMFLAGLVGLVMTFGPLAVVLI